jgi:Cu-Zn family superoxide dismutase
MPPRSAPTAAAILGAALAGGCAMLPGGADAPHMTVGEIITADILGAAGAPVGFLRLVQGEEGLLVRATFDRGALSPGWHGAHFHSVGDCSDHGQFQKSQGHVGRIEGGHGLLVATGPESGDLPNVWAGADGAAGAEFFTSLVTLDALQDADGSAFVVHAMEDDHRTQPIGGAGARVACAVVRGG